MLQIISRSGAARRATSLLRVTDLYSRLENPKLAAQAVCNSNKYKICGQNIDNIVICMGDSNDLPS